jgi:hypothetical protein
MPGTDEQSDSLACPYFYLALHLHLDWDGHFVVANGSLGGEYT